MAYHELADLVPRRLAETELCQLISDDPDTVAVADLTEAEMELYEEFRAEVDAEIDGYLGERYTVPLSTVPTLIRRLSITLTVVRLYERRYPEGVPEGIRRNQEDAQKLLRALADGRPTLGVQPAPSENGERVARIEGPDRVFSRDSLKDY